MLKSAYTSPKIHALARRLKIPFPHALGICGLLWNFTCDHAPDGNVGKHGALGIATATHWDGDENALLEALVSVRLIDIRDDGSLEIHQWDEHCPQWVKNKALKVGRTQVGPRSDPGRTGVEPGVGPGSLTHSSLTVVLPSESSLTESIAADHDETDASLSDDKARLTEDQIAAIANSPRKATWLKAVNKHCSQESRNALYRIIFGWPDGDSVWIAYEKARDGSKTAKRIGAYWAACVRNADKEMRSRR